MDDKCLSCSGAPVRSMELFKAACISYKPSSVLYRKTKVSRPKLMEMRKLLLEKCEEVISSGPWQQKLDGLTTEKIYSDLL